MKNQAGKTPLQLILIISIVILIVGISIAMIFEGTDIVSNIKEFFEKNQTVQTTEEK